MTVMYANALYQRGFVKEGYRALYTLLEQAMNTPVSLMYPGIPEYFDADGKGKYPYLTGAASWYMMTMVTQIFGFRGEWGDLVLEPKFCCGSLTKVAIIRHSSHSVDRHTQWFTRIHKRKNMGITGSRKYGWMVSGMPEKQIQHLHSVCRT